jgi:phosphopantothenoylcysteine decarboxylase/phosphopantothenate--cysteine ligase
MGWRATCGNWPRSIFIMTSPSECRVLITAGPTHEPIDAVRYLGNRSSGQLGIALAEAAAVRGMTTTLLLGPTALPPPHRSHLTVHRFQTTAELQTLLRKHWPQHDVLIMAAAVADYRPSLLGSLSLRERAGVRVDESNSDVKIKRGSQTLTLELEPTPDLLAEAAATARPEQRMIGFALEPADRLLNSAREKLRNKELHAIVANPLETMESPTITAVLLLADGRELAPPSNMPKPDFAIWLLDQLPAMVDARIV